jgi:hypothetical protein
MSERKGKGRQGRPIVRDRDDGVDAAVANTYPRRRQQGRRKREREREIDKAGAQPRPAQARPGRP